MEGRPYAVLLLRALLLGVQLGPVLYIVDIVLIESCRLLCTCFTSFLSVDATWLDTIQLIIGCAVDVPLDIVFGKRHPSQCRSFYSTTLHHLNAHLLLTLARASASLACWCALFAALAWLGAVKARLLRRITSTRWWRAKRALLREHSKNGM